MLVQWTSKLCPFHTHKKKIWVQVHFKSGINVRGVLSRTQISFPWKRKGSYVAPSKHCTRNGLSLINRLKWLALVPSVALDFHSHTLHIRHTIHYDFTVKPVVCIGHQDLGHVVGVTTLMWNFEWILLYLATKKASCL